MTSIVHHSRIRSDMSYIEQNTLSYHHCLSEK